MLKPKVVMITTIDNPFNPFYDFDNWYDYDIEKGYNTCAYLARVAIITEDMFDLEIDKETERAIDEIIEYDFTGLYKKITIS